MYTSVPCGSNVERGVSDHPGLAQIETEVLLRLQHHAWLRFAAIAVDLQFRHLTRMPAIGMMGTVVDSVQPGITLGEQRFEFGVDLRESGFIAFAPRDHGLIGDQDGAIAGLVDHAYCFSRAFDQLQIVRRFDALHFHIQCPVTIQKDSALWNRMDIGQVGIRQMCLEYSQGVFRGNRYYGS